METDWVYERSNPAPELMACKSFALRILSSVYIGSFSKLTQVLAVGNRSLSLPASRIANLGTSSLNPLMDGGQIPRNTMADMKESTHSNGGRLQLVANLNNALFWSWVKDSTTLQNAWIVGWSSAYNPPYCVFARRSSTFIGESTPPSRIWSSCWLNILQTRTPLSGKVGEIFGKDTIRTVTTWDRSSQTIHRRTRRSAS